MIDCSVPRPNLLDTTYMFVLAGLGLYKLAESRSPDLVPRVHVMLIIMAFIILVVVVGVVSATSCDM